MTLVYFGECSELLLSTLVGVQNDFFYFGECSELLLSTFMVVRNDCCLLWGVFRMTNFYF